MTHIGVYVGCRLEMRYSGASVRVRMLDPTLSMHDTHYIWLMMSMHGL